MAYVIIAILTLIALLGIWVTGLLLHWSVATMLIATGIAVGVAILALLIVLMIKLMKKGPAKPAAAKAPAPATVDLAIAKANIKAQNQQWREFLGSLKAAQLDGPALAQHPWYLVLGGTGAGKTSLMAFSGLGFTSVGGVGRTGGLEIKPTTAFDWWRTEDSLFVDTPGRFLNDPKAHPEWLNLLKLISTHRRNLALNGVLVCVPVGDLLRKGHEAMNAEAQAIRDRLDELTLHCGAAVPLYLVFTKCDAIGGFKDFFANIVRQEKEQVMGATLPWPLAGDIPGTFTTEHQRLAEALGTRRLMAMASARGDEAQKKLFQFPIQFQALNRVLNDFVTSLLHAGLRETATLRGFYFSSCFHTQQMMPSNMPGMPSAPGLAAAPTPASDSNLDKSIFFDPGKAGTPMPGVGGPSSDARLGFFLYDLFAKVVLPDRVMARQTRRAGRRQRQARFLMLLAIPLLAIAAIAWMAFSTTQVLATLETLHQPLEQVQTVAKSSPRDITRNLQALDQLGERITTLRRDGDSRLSTAVDAAATVQLERLRALLVEPSARIVHDDLDRARTQLQRSGRDATVAVQDEVYELYRVYQMMAGNMAFDVPSVRSVLEAKRRWYTGIESAPGKADKAAEDSARRHLDLYLVASGHTAKLRVETDKRLEEAVKRELGEGLWIRQAYEDILRSVAGRYGTTKAETLLTGPERSALALGHEFSLTFSQTAWDEVVKKAIDEKAEILERTFQELGNPRPASQLAKRLTDRFMEDHVRHWMTLLTTPTVATMRDFRDAPDLIARLSGRDSPIPELVRGTFRELALRTSGLAVLNDKEDLPWLEPSLLALGELRKDAQDYLASTEPGRRSGDIEKIRKLVERFNAVRQKIEDALQPLPSERRKAMLKGYENLLASLFAPLDQEIAQEQDRQWSDTVYRPFADQFAGRFPFAKDSRDDVIQADFAKLFNPVSGRIWAALLPIEGLRAIKFMGRPMVTLSADYERTARAAAEIKQIFFAGNSETINAPFTLTLIQREGVEDVVFSIGTQNYGLYDRPDAKFPLALKQGDASMSSRITIRIGNSQWRDLTILKQDWAVLRVLRAGDGKLQPKGGYLCTWSFEGANNATFKACALLDANGFEKAVVGDLLTSFSVPEHINNQSATTGSR